MSASRTDGGPAWPVYLGMAILGMAIWLGGYTLAATHGTALYEGLHGKPHLQGSDIGMLPAIVGFFVAPVGGAAGLIFAAWMRRAADAPERNRRFAMSLLGLALLTLLAVLATLGPCSGS